MIYTIVSSERHIPPTSLIPKQELNQIYPMVPLDTVSEMLSNEATKVETTPSKTNNSPGLNEAKKASKRKAKGASRKGGDECPIFLRSK